jgi:hypothetical protein
VPVWIPSYNGKKLKNIDRGRCAVEKIRTCDVDKVRPIILLFMLKVKKILDNEIITLRSTKIYEGIPREIHNLHTKKYIAGKSRAGREPCLATSRARTPHQIEFPASPTCSSLDGVSRPTI